MEDSTHKTWPEPYTAHNQQPTVNKDTMLDTEHKSHANSHPDAREAHGGGHNPQRQHATDTRTISDHKDQPFSPSLPRADEHNRQRGFTETTAPDLTYKSQSFSHPEHYLAEANRQRRLTTTVIPDTDYNQNQQTTAVAISDMNNTSRPLSYAGPRAEDYNRQQRLDMSSSSNSGHFSSHAGLHEDQDQQRPSRSNPFGCTSSSPPLLLSSFIALFVVNTYCLLSITRRLLSIAHRSLSITRRSFSSTGLSYSFSSKPIYIHIQHRHHRF